MNNLSAFLLAGILFITACTEQPEYNFIAVNLVGYDQNLPKQAFLVNAEADSFRIERFNSSEVVYTGAVGQIQEADPATGDRVSIIDFSDFNLIGDFIIKTGGAHVFYSHKFSVAPDTYSEATLTALESYYYHRCGTHVDNGNEWKYNFCHLDDAPFYDNPLQSQDVTGGWHDAGDYNKFTVNTSLSAALLLYLYEDNMHAFHDGQLQIPEAGNGIPDILDEVSWTLRWMLKMQRADGAVYHKVSQKEWIGEFTPNTDPSVRYLFDVSSAATASFAATASLGARLLYPFDETFSSELAFAARLSWRFLEQNNLNIPLGGFVNPEDVFGGDYGDHNDLDERLWASVELFKLTGEDRYLNYFLSNYRRVDFESIPALSWREVQILVLRSFLSIDLQSRFQGERNELLNAMLNQAGSLLEVQKRNNYLNLIRHTEYYWGSNSVGLGYAFHLILAYRLTEDERYNHAALDQLHYVLGRNPFNLSQVTGIGTRSVSNPYHQLSEIGNFSNPVPGMLVGGPNNHLLLRGREISPFPGKNYEDRFNNYLVNEPAINFTAILAYVMGHYAFSEASEVKPA